jgi:hypothetical protein
MKKPRPLALAGLALAFALAGCGLLPGLPFGGEVRGIADVAVGDCLDGMIGFDSDRNAVVDCGAAHRYEVTAVAEWPGFAAAIAESGDAGAAWDDVNLSEEVSPYWMWASTTCSKASRDALGVDDIEVQGHTAAELWLTVGGEYGIDQSLPSRTGFLAGDHRTVCSVAWYDENQEPRRVTLPDGLRFADITDPGFDAGLHDCWSDAYVLTDCEQPHYGQVLAGFDGLDAFGDQFVVRAGNGTQTDEDWESSDAFCADLIGQALPETVDLDGLAVIADISPGAGWLAWDGDLDPAYSYRFACLAIGPGFEPVSGDVFAGVATVGAGT